MEKLEKFISGEDPLNKLINHASKHLYDFIICKKKQKPSAKITIKAINILFFLSSIWILSTALSTTPLNQPLTDKSTIISFDLGILFNKVTVQTVVWVANRETPVNGTSSTLNLTRQWILTLVNGSGRVILSSNSSRHVKKPIAQLLDSGNLVVRDDSIEDYLWQSFDYPTDTALPRMKLGIDLKIGFRGFLRSWKSRNDPLRGRGFSKSPSQLPSPDYIYTYVSDPEKVSFVYQLTEGLSLVCATVATLLSADVWINFTPKDPTKWARGNWSKGCVRKTLFYFQNEVKFLKY
uniref:Bulb-type lectin domain-containing protein n=1 Tax=Solanum lycopersicum TaxID=4081 RepID=A0A3Q7EWP2_SOLLC